MRHPPYRNALRHLLLLIGLLTAWGCPGGSERAPTGPPIPLSLAVRPAPDAALVAIAQDQGFFKQAGLAVSLTFHSSGREAMAAVCGGQAQVATVSDVAFAVKALDDPALRVLAAIGTTTVSQIVARKDRGIRTPADLRGKRVGFSAGTTSDYFLYAFLLTENISPDEITAVNIPPARQVDAVVQGEVDALSAFGPNAFAARKRMGDSGLYWDCQNNLAYHWLLATREGAAPSAQALQRLFAALLRAEAFAIDNDARVQALLVRQWHLDPEYVRQAWPGTRIRVSFGQSIVSSLRVYFNWWTRQSAPGHPPVDVVRFLDTGALDQAAPRLVTLFR